jgi:heptosyltransferase-2
MKSVSESRNVKRKILVVAPAWVGDMVMAQSLLLRLKELYQPLSIDVLAPRATLPLLDRMVQVDNGLPLDIGHGQLLLRKRYRTGKALRQTNYDQAIVLPNSFKSALVPWFGKIPVRTGWKGEFRYGLLNDLRHLDKSRLPLMVQRFCALATRDEGCHVKETPVPALSVDEANLGRLLASLQLNLDRPVLGLCPGAEYGTAKQWPARYYAAVANHFINEGGQVWIFGSKGDVPVGQEIISTVSAKHRSACLDLTGKTELVDVVDLISQTNCIVSNDSGLMHISAALNRPMVVIYGSSSPEFTPPLSNNAEIASVELDCSPCFKRDCPFGHTDCLRQLYPERVIELLACLVVEEGTQLTHHE